MNWNSMLGREPFICFLAFLIIAAWLTTYFLHLTTEQTLTNVVMIIIGYFYGSSSGSKKKDDVVNDLATKTVVPIAPASDNLPPHP